MALRVPSNAAVAMPVAPAAAPLVAVTPTRAYCEPPVNITRLRKQVCQMSRPAATDNAPKETPYAAVARPTAHPERAAMRPAGVRSAAAASGRASGPTPADSAPSDPAPCDPAP